jgi:hypothetical protein
MSSDLDDLIREIDSFLGPATSRKRPPVTPRAEPLPEIRYWVPEAVALVTHPWRCKCGATGEGTPALFVREKCGRQVRLVRCSRTNYSLLPRIELRLDAELLDACPACFSPADESRQLPLFASEEPAEFKRPSLAPAEIDQLEQIVAVQESFIEELSAQVKKLLSIFEE